MTETAVLFSGGLDSAVLLAQQAQSGIVHPLYVSSGLAWEAAERRAAAQLLASPCFDGRVRPLVALEFTVRDVYAPGHWAIRGQPPAYDTPDEDVYLVGRNLVLLSKAGIYCGLRKVSRLVLGPLADNPFPDARPEFLEAMAKAISLGLDQPIVIDTPLSSMHKEDVIALGRRLGVPLELTLSCMNPVMADGGAASGLLHCGACSKCRERQQAFAAAGVPDPTAYASRG
jgi:7-cyano-7-deazaguanine synthase